MGLSDAKITATNVVTIGVAILFADFVSKHFVFKSETSGRVEMARERFEFVKAMLELWQLK